MRLLSIIIIFLFISCSQQAQEDGQLFSNLQVNSMFRDEKINKDAFDKVRIDSVADIPKGTNETSVTFIKSRLQKLVGIFLKSKCLENGIQYPPGFILFRFFKYEKEFEVWAGNSRKDSLKRILLLPVCAVDDIPGTKLEQGDGKTPEGFYNAPLYYGSTADFMWIKLNNKEIDTYGKVNYGSSFKMCLDYPNSLDRLKTKTILKHNNPGSAICIHGNCVSIGCISFVNRNYLPVYLASMYHNTKSYGYIKIHIFPFRFDKYDSEEKLQLAKNVVHMKSEKVIKDWENLEEAYNLFNKKHRALNITISGGKYLYSYY